MYGTMLDIFKSLRLKRIANIQHTNGYRIHDVFICKHLRSGHTPQISRTRKETTYKRDAPKKSEKKQQPTTKECEIDNNNKKGTTKNGYNNNAQGSCISRKTFEKTNREMATTQTKNQRRKHNYHCYNLISLAHRRANPPSK